MAYNKQNFESGQILTASHLNNMEKDDIKRSLISFGYRINPNTNGKLFLPLRRRVLYTVCSFPEQSEKQKFFCSSLNASACSAPLKSLLSCMATETSFSPPTEQRYNTLDFACRKIVCQKEIFSFWISTCADCCVYTN